MNKVLTPSAIVAPSIHLNGDNDGKVTGKRSPASKAAESISFRHQNGSEEVVLVITARDMIQQFSL
jgi:hypothetical protein